MTNALAYYDTAIFFREDARVLQKCTFGLRKFHPQDCELQLMGNLGNWLSCIHQGKLKKDT